MRIQWHGHSCFQVYVDGASVVFDPYEDGSVPGLAPLRLTADAVCCSHEHRDHSARRNVTLTGRDFPGQILSVASFHDDKRGLLRGRNTIHVLCAQGLRVAHLGDLGHTLSDKALAAIGPLDAVMIPVGGHYTIDAETAQAVLDQLRPRVVLPMHYRLGGMGYDVIGTLDRFTALRGDVRYYESDTLDLTADVPAQTAVLTYGK